MTLRATALLVAVLAAGSVLAAPGLTYTPVSCVRADEMPLLQVTVAGEGELRGFFRRVNSTDWCSVEGVNDGRLSRVVLPKFEEGAEIEYFMVLADGRRILARTPDIYRVTVAASCELPAARNVLPLALSCGDDVQETPTAMGAAYAMSTVEPVPFSPESPEAQ